jgi:hypothetical protein
MLLGLGTMPQTGGVIRISPCWSSSRWWPSLYSAPRGVDQVLDVAR